MNDIENNRSEQRFEAAQLGISFLYWLFPVSIFGAGVLVGWLLL